MYTSSGTRLEWPGRGHYSSRTQINARGQNRTTIRVTSLAIIEVEPVALGQIWHTPRNRVSMRPEQMHTPSDTRLEWLGEGPIFKSDSDKRWRAKMQPLSESFPGPLLMWGPWTDMVTTRKSYIGDLNKCILHLTQDWSGLGRGHYSNKRQWPKRDHYLSHPIGHY